MSAWLTIDSAPKNGTQVLLYAPATVYEGKPVPARLTYGAWIAPSETPRLEYKDGYAPEEVWDDFDASWVSWDGGFTEEHPPTHWMPLPTPPVAPDLLQMLHECAEYIAALNGEQDDYCQRARALIARATGAAS